MKTITLSLIFFFCTVVSQTHGAGNGNGNNGNGNNKNGNKTIPEDIIKPQSPSTIINEYCRQLPEPA
jgi:hypothetical protein